ncbi:MAG: hypothetical protein P4L90_02040 [Rhodopila sp.]|nr:hypothetical protein [Rhodopila sp.]
MNLADRQRQFAEAAQKRFGATKATRLSKLFGVSNSAKIIEGGIQLGVSNLETASPKEDAYIFACVLKFPPEDEVYFAVLVRSAREQLVARLDAMKALGAAAKATTAVPAAALLGTDEELGDDAGTGSIPYSARNNLAVVYIAGDGRIYLRNAKFWESLKIDLVPFAPAAEIDGIAVALYPPAVSARRSLLAREFVGYLGSLVGREKVHELTVWPDESALSPTMCRMPPVIPLGDIETAVTALGGHYPGGEVRRYHAALNFLPDKHFVILAGLSGTGKTRLALNYARAVHGVAKPDGADPLLFVCPVRPEWTDPTGLTGYPDVLSGRYVVPPFLEAVLVATAHRDSPVFVVLDELNLARVEYYLSDVLSCIETGEPLQLHSNSVPMEGSNGTPVIAAIPIPSNLFITGTINVDETTNPVSDKVLDRAVVIDMSRVDLTGFLDGLVKRYPELVDARKAAGPVLLDVQTALLPHNLGFGYRVAQEVVRYHAFAATHAGGTGDVLDDLMVQKVLVKLRGADRQRGLLTGLQKALVDLPRSQALLKRLLDDLDEFGSFQATR